MSYPIFGQALTSRVSLSISCNGLLNKDVTSKSDPIVQVMIQSPLGEWKEVGI